MPYSPAEVATETPRADRLAQAAINFAASGDNTVVALAAGQRIAVHRLFLVATAATVITFKSGATALTGAIPLAAGGAFVLDLSSEPWFVTGVAEAFVINSTVATQISGRVYSEKGP